MKQSFISTSAFSEKYEVLPNNIYVYLHKNEYPSNLIKKTNQSHNQIDERYFLRRKQFIKKIWLQAHENYYFLNRHLSTNGIAEAVSIIEGKNSQSNWNTFLTNDLFLLPKESIFSTRVNDKLWRFHRISTSLIRRLFKQSNVKLENRKLEILIERI